MHDFHRLEHKLRQGIQGERYGSFQSLFHGTGIEVDDFRLYQPGTSTRHINWKMSAKHQELWTNVMHDEQDITIEIFLDVNANRSSGVRKSNRSLISQWLADLFLFVREHDLRHVDIHLAHAGKTVVVPCQTVAAWMQAWQQITIAVDEVRKSSKYTSAVSSYIDHLLPVRRQRIVFLVSDFLVVDSQLQEQLNYLDQHHIMSQIRVEVPQIVGKQFMSLST